MGKTYYVSHNTFFPNGGTAGVRGSPGQSGEHDDAISATLARLWPSQAIFVRVLGHQVQPYTAVPVQLTQYPSGTSYSAAGNPMSAA